MTITPMTLLTSLLEIYSRYCLQRSPRLISSPLALIQVTCRTSRSKQSSLSDSNSQNFFRRGVDHLTNDASDATVGNLQQISSSGKSQIDLYSSIFNTSTLPNSQSQPEQSHSDSKSQNLFRRGVDYPTEDASDATVGNLQQISSLGKSQIDLESFIFNTSTLPNFQNQPEQSYSNLKSQNFFRRYDYPTSEASDATAGNLQQISSSWKSQIDLESSIFNTSTLPNSYSLPEQSFSNSKSQNLHSTLREIGFGSCAHSI